MFNIFENQPRYILCFERSSTSVKYIVMKICMRRSCDYGVGCSVLILFST